MNHIIKITVFVGIIVLFVAMTLRGYIMTQDKLARTITLGDIRFEVPQDFAVATTSDEIKEKSYIPPCDQAFDYCLYYTGSDLSGTNFESAGFRVKKRTDLVGEKMCLTDPSEGYVNELSPRTTVRSLYSTCTFLPRGDAATGHSAMSVLYRLCTKAGACYEIETRIGQSRFDNYPEGTIKKFSDSDATLIRTKLDNIVASIKLDTGEQVVFSSPYTQSK